MQQKIPDFFVKFPIFCPISGRFVYITAVTCRNSLLRLRRKKVNRRQEKTQKGTSAPSRR